MIELIQYNPKHYKMITDAIEPFASNGTPITENGLSITGVDGNAMACGGVYYNENKEGVLWLRLNKHCMEKPISWARAIRDSFDIILKHFDGDVSTYVLDGFCRGDRMAKFVGLKKTNEKEIINGRAYYKYTRR